MSAAGTAELRPLTSSRPAVPGERTAKFVWCGVVVGFLGMELVMCGVAATLATGDPSFAVVPGYHEQALRWDESRAAERASAGLGWKAAVTPTAAAGVFGDRPLTITLRDAADRPVTGAAVEAVVFHHARAAEARTATFAETAEPGVYAATTEMRRGGLWEVRLDARRGADRFVSAVRLDLPSAAAGDLAGGHAP